MGCNVREKHIRTNRRPKSAKPESDQTISVESGLKNQLNYQLGVQDSADSNQNPNLTSGSNPNSEDGNWNFCSEEHMEDVMLKNLEFLYNEAVSRLISLGYDEEVALNAILRNGHCFGGMDILSNIMNNTLSYLNSGSCGGSESDGSSEEKEVRFTDLRQLQEYSLNGMVGLLQQVKPHLTRGDAMWCLLMCDLHMTRASKMDLHVGPHSCCSNESSDSASNNVETVGKTDSNLVGGTPSSVYRFHGGCGGNGSAPEMSLQRDLECSERFNLTPTMQSLLKRNVALFAAGFRAHANESQMQFQGCSSSLSNRDSWSGVKNVESPIEQNDNGKNQDLENAMLNKFRNMNLDEKMNFVLEDQKDEMILSLIHQVKDLEKQVKDRKEWAHQKAMQAARKLSNDLTELKMLRMEREETQRLKQGKPTPEDPTMKRLSEMESALRKASGQVDRANAAVRRLETENAEIRAEMEASKLSASESVTACMEVSKREKKYLKKLVTWEKQKSKMQEEIAVQKQKISEAQQQMVEIEASKKDAEAKWRRVQKLKEAASAQVEEEKRLKEATEAENKRRHEALRVKIEIDFQRHKDDLQRLEQEFSRLKSSATANYTPAHGDPRGETIARLLEELEDSSSEKSGSERECIICKKEEVSVVFLPCNHQVLCAKCNEEYGNKGRAICPCCRVLIEQRIRVFGATSS